MDPFATKYASVFSHHWCRIHLEERFTVRSGTHTPGHLMSVVQGEGEKARVQVSSDKVSTRYLVTFNPRLHCINIHTNLKPDLQTISPPNVTTSATLPSTASMLSYCFCTSNSLVTERRSAREGMSSHAGTVALPIRIFRPTHADKSVSMLRRPLPRAVLSRPVFPAPPLSLLFFLCHVRGNEIPL